MEAKYDFSGWVTKNDLECSDGRTIRRNAFKDCDGKTVPLVFMHNHTDIGNVIGKVFLENRPEGVYGYASCNGTENGRNAKEIVKHGDVAQFSIWANNLVQRGGDVLHGVIREVSLVLSGANPGAYIDFPILEHSGETIDDEAIIYTGESLDLYHGDEDVVEDEEEKPVEESQEEEKSEETDKEPEKEENDDMNENLEHADDMTVEDVVNTMNDDQKKAMYYLISQALEDGDDESEDNEVKHNVFESTNENEQGNFLSHDEMATIINDAKKYGSMKESFLAHAQEYGIEYIDYLFPDAKAINPTPEFIQRDTGWVSAVINGTHHTPFSRVKSLFANITEDEARAKGYFKGKLKKEEVFALLKRSTDPQTIYKKQKLDRDDVIDITDFDVIAWLKAEMRDMLDEEIARAILIGDGRNPADDDRISEDHIRSIMNDADLYSTKVKVGSTDPKDFIENAIRYRKFYKGSGNPVLFTTEDMLTEMLLIPDRDGKSLYASEAELATKLRVSKIYTVEVMEGVKAKDGGDLLGIIVNLKDYNVGADKGGAISMFDDFDIDYNQMKYLIETRCSGALIKPYAALVLSSAEGETKKADPRDYYEDRSGNDSTEGGSTESGDDTNAEG